MSRRKAEMKNVAKWVPRVEGNGPELIVKGQIDGVLGTIVIDTGAQVSLLKVGVSNAPKTRIQAVVHGVTGSVLKLYGVQRVPIDFGVDQRYWAEVMVTDLPEGYLAIIGYDLLKEWGAVIDLPRNTLRLSRGDVSFIHGKQSDGMLADSVKSLSNSKQKSKQPNDRSEDVEGKSQISIGRREVITPAKPLSGIELEPTTSPTDITTVKPELLLGDVFMYCSEEVTLPPRCERAIVVKMNKKYANSKGDVEAVLEPTELRIHGVYCARVLGRVRNGRGLVKLINVTREELVVPKNTRLVKIEFDLPNEHRPGISLACEQSKGLKKNESAIKAGCRPQRRPTQVEDRGKARNANLPGRKQCFRNERKDLQVEFEKKLRHLSAEDKDIMMETLLEYEDLFFDENNGQLGCTSEITHKIDTGNAPPIYKRAYRVPHAQREVMNKLIQDQLDRGIIVPSKSPYAAPVIIVPKKTTDGTPKYRFCVDFRSLNLVTTPDVYPLPNINETIDMLGNAKYFTTIDLASGFHQVRMDPDSEEKTAFNVPGGHYQYKRLPMGLINSPATFQRLMDNVLMGLKDELCLVYLDDIIIIGTDMSQHKERIHKVFSRLREANLSIQLEKCQFASNEVDYLGHKISDQGVKPDPRKIQAVKDYPQPSNAKDIRAYLGLIGYYRKFIPHFAEIAKPLTQLTKKDVKFHWDEQCTAAFNELNSLLIKDPILVFPDFSLPFVLATDASGVALGAVLSQVVNGAEHPVAYASRQLNSAERAYSTTERELLALLWATKYFRCYLYGRKFTAVTDHIALKWMLSLKDPSSRLMRWNLRLAEFDYVVIHKSGKANTNADSLSRHVLWNNTELVPLLDLELIRQHQSTDAECQVLSGRKKVKMSPENVLYYEVNGNKKIIVPCTLQDKVISLHHDIPTAGHAGVKKTVHRIKERFWWKDLDADVTKYIQSCHECSQRRDIGKLRAPLGSFNEPEAPFERIAIDIVGPLPLSESSNKYILSVVDHFSRFVEFVALPNQTAECVARALVHRVITKFGIPKQLLTDRGANFTGELMKQMCGLLKIKRLFTSPYHPMSNGRVERIHRTVASMLSHYVNKNQTDWDEYLPYVGMAINSQLHESTGYSPFEIVFGRKMSTPLESDLSISDNTEIYNDHVEHLRSKLRDMQHISRTKQGSARQSQKKQYDKRTKIRRYEAGQYVYLHTPQIGRHRVKKLAKLWTGPHQIISVLSELNVKLRIRNRESVVHVNRIKPCISRRPLPQRGIAKDGTSPDSNSSPVSQTLTDNDDEMGPHVTQESEKETDISTEPDMNVDLPGSEVPTAKDRQKARSAVGTARPLQNRRAGNKPKTQVAGDTRTTLGTSQGERRLRSQGQHKTIALRSGRTVKYL